MRHRAARDDVPAEGLVGLVLATRPPRRGVMDRARPATFQFGFVHGDPVADLGLLEYHFAGCGQVAHPLDTGFGGEVGAGELFGLLCRPLLFFYR